MINSQWNFVPRDNGFVDWRRSACAAGKKRVGEDRRHCHDVERKTQVRNKPEKNKCNHERVNKYIIAARAKKR